jgi:hypothetical protein
MPFVALWFAAVATSLVAVALIGLPAVPAAALAIVSASHLAGVRLVERERRATARAARAVLLRRVERHQPEDQSGD